MPGNTRHTPQPLSSFQDPPYANSSEKPFLRELLLAARRADLAPAPFPRPYWWRQQDVLALLHSINKGYPIGSFLM